MSHFGTAKSKYGFPYYTFKPSKHNMGIHILFWL